MKRLIAISLFVFTTCQPSKEAWLRDTEKVEAEFITVTMEGVVTGNRAGKEVYFYVWHDLNHHVLYETQSDKPNLYRQGHIKEVISRR